MRALALGEYTGDILHRHEEDGYELTRTAHEPRLNVDAHTHASAYFCLVLRGGFVETSARGRYECRPGTLVFHPHRDPHEDVLLPEGSECLNVQLPIGALNDSRSLVSLGGPLTWIAARLVKSPSAESARHLAAETARYLAPRVIPDTVKRANGLLAQPEDWTVGTLADEVGAHPVHLSRLYRQTYGHTLREHLIRARLRRATLLLAEGHLSLAEIAVTTGFFDQSHFTTAFRERAGLTPADFRRCFS